MALKLWSAVDGAIFEVHVRFTGGGGGGFGVAAKHPDDNTPITPTSSVTTLSEATWTFPAFVKNTLVSITCVDMMAGASVVVGVECKQGDAVLACRDSVTDDPLNGPVGGPFEPVAETVALTSGSGAFGLIITDLI